MSFIHIFSTTLFRSSYNDGVALVFYGSAKPIRLFARLNFNLLRLPVNFNQRCLVHPFHSLVDGLLTMLACHACDFKNMFHQYPRK